MTEVGVPPGSDESLVVMALPGDDGYVRLRIFRLMPDNESIGECIQSVALYPEAARRIAMNLTKSSIECEEAQK